MLLTCGGGIGITACINGGGAARKQRILYCVEPWVHNHKWIPQNLYRAKPLAYGHKKIPNILVMKLKQWLETSGEKPYGFKK